MRTVKWFSYTPVKLMYNILTPSITAIYKFLRTYGGSRHIYICPWLAKGSVTEMEGFAQERVWGSGRRLKRDRNWHNILAKTGIGIV